MQLFINQKLYITDNTSLKSTLTALGYFLPCGGKGICGRCGIIADSLLPTALDRRFFTQEELSNGYRLSCDKTVVDGMNITVELKKIFRPTVKLTECDFGVIIRDTYIELALLNNGITDTVVLPNSADSRLLSVLGTHMVELLETYGIARATNVYLSGNHVTSILFGDTDRVSGYDYLLPTEEIEIIRSSSPIPMSTILEASIIENDTLLVDCTDSIPYLLYRSADTLLATQFPSPTLNVVTALTNQDSSLPQVTLQRLFLATLAYMGRAATNIRIIGNLPVSIIQSSFPNHLVAKFVPSALSLLSEVVDNKRKRTKLATLIRKLVVDNLFYQEDTFQNILNTI